MRNMSEHKTEATRTDVDVNGHYFLGADKKVRLVPETI